MTYTDRHRGKFEDIRSQLVCTVAYLIQSSQPTNQPVEKDSHHTRKQNMADHGNNNPGNFANRPKEEVQAIASKGGQASHNSGFASMDPDKQACYIWQSQEWRMTSR